MERYRGIIFQRKHENLNTFGLLNKTGDVIYLQNGEACPADIIILDTNLIKMKEAICYIDMYLINGKTEPVKRKASCLSNG